MPHGKKPSAWPQASALPFTLLADDAGATTERILGRGNHAGLCVADRYGIIYFVEAASDVSTLPPASTVVEWLEYIEIQCPECTDGSDSDLAFTRDFLTAQPYFTSISSAIFSPSLML